MPKSEQVVSKVEWGELSQAEHGAGPGAQLTHEAFSFLYSSQNPGHTQRHRPQLPSTGMYPQSQG